MECIRAVIPAAGLSSRMNDFKPLLMLHGRTLIENCVSSLLKGGAETVTVVTGFRADEIEHTLSSSFGRSVSFIRNIRMNDPCNISILITQVIREFCTACNLIECINPFYRFSYIHDLFSVIALHFPGSRTKSVIHGLRIS